MSRVEEIERAIRDLPPGEFAEIVRRIRDIEQDRWEARLAEDAAAGRLDFLIEEARSERQQGLLQEWPPRS